MSRGSTFFSVLFFVCVWGGRAAAVYAGEIIPGTDQLPRYNIHATVDVLNKKIIATQTVIFTNTSSKPINELYFHLYSNRQYMPQEKKFILRYASYFKVNPFPDGFQSGAIHIRSVAQGQAPLEFFIEGEDKTLLKIPLGRDVPSGGSVEVKIDFEVTIPHAYGRFGWHEQIFALSRWYPILSVLDDHGWNNHPFYPFHRPFFSESGYYSVDLAVPADQVAIYSGQLKESISQNDGTKILKIESPLPIREFTLAMSPDYQVLEKDFQGIKIKSFYLPGNEFYANEALQDVSDLMQAYGKRFGAYPYPEFSVAPVYLGYGGEQMSNLIFIDTRIFQLPKFLTRYFDFLIAHETGHQWFYNLVGTDEFNQMWMEEGVNSFFLLDYLEDKYGPNAKVMHLPQKISWLLPDFSFREARDTRYMMVARTSLDRPIVGKLSSFSEPSSIFSLTYGKGAGVVSMLRFIMGQEAFDKAYRRIFEEIRFKNLSLDQLMRICEQESGKDLKWFFTQWLDTAKHCDYSIEKSENHKIALSNRGGIVMPVKLKVQYRDGSEEVFNWDGAERIKEISVDDSKTIQKIILDPDWELLDIDRTNNVWPRQLYLKPVPFYIGVYDFPVFLPDDSYNLVIGPEVTGSAFGIKASLQKPYDQNFYVGSGYVFAEGLYKSRVGYQVNNLFRSQTTAGFELFNVNDVDSDEEDLAGGKLFLRKELWPAAYGLGEINDHISLYLLRDRSLRGDLASGLEDTRNTSYLRKDESIIGMTLHLGRSGPYPDPKQGYKIDSLIENSGHFLSATQYFYRASMDVSFYQPVTTQSTFALRMKYGFGYPDDKNLFELGGMNGLRGFDRKTIRGAEGFLGSAEYRFPLLQRINLSAFDHHLGLESVGGVAFFDAGQAWFNDFDDTQLKKDAGLGLRFMVNIGSFLEKVLLRFDAAQSINESKEDPHYWFTVNHAF